MPTAQKVDNIDPEIEEAGYPFQGIGLNLLFFLFRVTMTTTTNGAPPLAPRLPLEMTSTLPPRWQALPVH
jgi:hypothetical protein